MPDLTPLPPLPDPPEFAARREVFDAAARTARRRVRTSCAAVATGVAVFVAAAALPDGSAPAVGIAPTTTGTGLPTAPPTALPTEVHATTGPGRVDASPGGGRVQVGESPAASARPTASAAADPTPDPRPEPTKPAAPAPEPDGTTRAVVADDGAPGCHRVTDDDRDAWCYRSRGVRAVDSGARSSFVLEVCRTGEPDGALRFIDGNEVKVELRQGDSMVWINEYTGAESNAAHDVAVPAGHCVRWTAAWTVTDRDGRALDPGGYHVNWWLVGEHDPGQAGPPRVDGGITIETWSDEYDLTVR